LEYLLKKLDALAIPHSGSDRFDLLDSIIIRDFVALFTFALFPNDDFNLASLIKSPFLQLTENDLYELCHLKEKRSITLLSALKILYPTAYEFLEKIQEKSKTSGVRELYFYLLEFCGLHERILARFGPQAEDILHKFQLFINTHENNYSSSLLSLIYRINSEKNEIKKDLDIQQLDQVRIMTIHAAKGLQAPIVFLVDTNASPNTYSDKILWHREKFDYELPLYPTTGTNLLQSFKIEDADEIYAEYLRLLYVALTRAENELYLCGLAEKPNSSRITWYDICCNALQQLGATPAPFDFDAQKFKWIYGKVSQDKNAFDELTSQLVSPFKISNFAHPKNTLHQLLPQQIISPAKSSDFSNNSSNSSAITGQLIHELLEILPRIIPQQRSSIIAIYLQKTLHSLALAPVAKKNIRKNIHNVLTNKTFQKFFSSASRAEVPIAGSVDGLVISGRLDRLVILPDTVMLLDYKSTYKNFDNDGQLPDIYIQQLDLYCKLLKKIYPTKALESYILLTSSGTLVRIH
jgi:ATP-dependent helicase/nuclease subunit A